MFNNLTARQKSLIETSLSRELFHFVKIEIVSLMLYTINDLFLKHFVYLNEKTWLKKVKKKKVESEIRMRFTINALEQLLYHSIRLPY